MTAPAAAALPHGTRVALDPDTVVADRGATVAGGRPWRTLRLSDRGARAVCALAAGAPVADGVAAALARRLVDAGMAAVTAPPEPPPDVAGALAGTVVVPARDRAGSVAELLGALTCPAVVVDDGSRDPTALAAVAEAGGATLVTLPDNRGPAAARNAGAAEVATPLVVFVDSDARVTPAVLDRLAAHFADPAVGAVAPRIRAQPRTAWPAPLDAGPRPGDVGPGRRIRYVPSTVLAVRVDALRAVGGFDPALRRGEDVDLVWRLADAGWRVRYDPAAVAEHLEPRRARAHLVRRFGYGTSAGPLAARHRGRLSGPALAGLAAPWVVRRAVARGAADPELVAGLGGRVAARTAAGTLRWALPLWWPAALCGRHRLRVAGAVAVALAAGAATGRQEARRVAAAALAEAAYGAGVWVGCVTAGQWRPLLPTVRPPRPGRS